MEKITIQMAFIRYPQFWGYLFRCAQTWTHLFKCPQTWGHLYI